MIMSIPFNLLFYFFGTLIQRQMKFGINMMLLTNEKYKRKDCCSVDAVLTPVQLWTFMNSWEREVRPDAWEESVSTG